MKEWKVEEMVLFNERLNHPETINEMSYTQNYWNWETEFSEQEKIAFIDKYADSAITDYKDYRNIATYILNLMDKLATDSVNMPKTTWGNIKKVSLKAWINRNDHRHICDTSYFHGGFTLFNITYYLQDGKKQRGTWGIYDNCVDQWFHSLLIELFKLERQWYTEHDPLQVKIKALSGYVDYYGTEFSCNYIRNVIYDDTTRSKAKQEDIDFLIGCYEKLEKCVDNIQNKIAEYGLE